MKSLCAIAVLFLLSISIHTTAQAPGWEWARGTGGLDEGISNSLSADAFGNVYVTGTFSCFNGSVIVFGTDTLTCTGHQGEAFFIVKYDSSGNVIWARASSATSTSAGVGICTDTQGNVYITGATGAGTILGNDTLSGGVLVTKYAASGNLIWAKCAGANSYCAGQSICTDNNSNVYVTGFFRGPTIIFGTDTFNNADTVLSNAIFLVKYDSAGNMVWAKTAGGDGNDVGSGISADNFGNIYITGFFTSPTISFANDTFNTISGGEFIVKYNASGNQVWAKSASGNIVNSKGGQSISTDPSGNVYVTGNFSSPILVFGTDTLTNNALGGQYHTNMFIVKYDTSGNVIWVKRAGGTNADYSQDISTDAFGNFYLTGYFISEVISFGNDTLVNDWFNVGSPNGFIVKYDTSGTVVWAKTNWETYGGVESVSVSPDLFGNVYITGTFISDSIALGNDTLTNRNDDNFNFFIAKIGDHLSTGIPNITNPANSIIVFPNPSTSTFNFSGVTPRATIQIYNVLGEIIYSSIADNSNYRVTLNNQAKGIYFYRVSEPSGQTISIRPTTTQQTSLPGAESLGGWQGKIVLE